MPSALGLVSHNTLLRIPSCDADTLILGARQASVKVWLGGMPRRIKEQMRGKGTSSQATLIRWDSSLKNTL